MKNINSVEFKRYEWDDDSPIMFYLYEKGLLDEGYIDQVNDISLKSAIEYFSDNFDGEFIIEWFDEELHQYEITL
jgi:hypothetical protein